MRPRIGMRLTEGVSKLKDLDWREKIDFARLLDSRAFSIQGTCASSSLFKYYHFHERDVLSSFLSKPTVKLATKTDLNDPFDLSRRWEKFSSAETVDFIKRYVIARFERELADAPTLVRRLVSDPRFKGTGVSISTLYMMLNTAPVRAYIEEQKQSFYQQLPQLIDAAFDQFAPEIDGQIERAFNSIGILSLTENPANRAMWGLYAASGRGFVLEFNAQHPFFLATRQDGSTTNKLMKVLYTDERWNDFWQNPLSLFAVKNVEFSFEREWRLLGDTDGCEKIETQNGPLFLMEMPPRLLNSIVFGHKVANDECDMIYEALASHQHGILSLRAVPNMSDGEFHIVPLN